MSLFDRQSLLTAGAAGSVGDAHDFQVAADRCLSLGDEVTALIALDRAYGLAPHDAAIASMRAALLDRFAVEEHGLVFRYVPAGTFSMGSTTGDPDERPVHPVTLDQFWIAEIPMTWTAFSELAGWSAPPDSRPPDAEANERGRFVHHGNKIRVQYCSSGGSDSGPWPERLGKFDRKPMVAVSWNDAERLAKRMSNDRVEYALPSEAEWEKAARGGLIGKRYPWGDEPPTRERCDFDHFGEWELADPCTLPPNGYGVHGMAGGVWEWTAAVYDALAYGGAQTPAIDPSVYEADLDDVPEDQPLQRVLRGGSWTDAAAAVTVSFRAAAVASFNPNVGFRLVRRVRAR
ncbi:MAG TPA: SUMF1/EgtB/PvdO family nonheme iron enzyme [Enhygromyxa sp.]|nr:SUMF1/EgtB/PvdO family nonheme iron enzyme [Enhygromyxa sp.]